MNGTSIPGSRYPSAADAGNSLTHNGFRITTRKLPILKAEPIEQMTAELGITPPEMIFGNNMVSIQHVPSGWGINFNTFDALDRVDKTGGSMLQVAHSKEWQSTREKKHEGITEVVKPFDWSYTTDYKGTLTSASPVFEPAASPIPLDLLRRPDPILFFDEVILYEDEMADNGITMYSCKIRVMPARLLLLCRFFMRLDNVLLRIRDTRVYFEFATGEVIREYVVKEDSYEAVRHKLAMKGLDVPAQLRDPNALNELLPIEEKSLERLVQNFGERVVGRVDSSEPRKLNVEVMTSTTPNIHQNIWHINLIANQISTENKPLASPRYGFQHALYCMSENIKAPIVPASTSPQQPHIQSRFLSLSPPLSAAQPAAQKAVPPHPPAAQQSDNPPPLGKIALNGPSTAQSIAAEVRKRASSVTETYIAYGVSEKLVKECARQADYTIPQAGEKGVEIPKTKDGEDLGIGTGYWYDTLNLTPTFNTWAQITFLHMYLLTVRIRCFPAAHAPAWHQHLLDHFFYAAEDRMVTMHNVHARSIRNKYLKDLFVQWRGLMAGYDESLVKGDAVLATAVWRNVFKGEPETDLRRLGEVVSYMRGVLEGLGEMDDKAVAGGEVVFGDPESEREGVLVRSRGLDMGLKDGGGGGTVEHVRKGA